MSILNINNIDLYKKKVLIRSDLNVPIKKNKIVSDTRIKLSLPTILTALKKGAKVMVMSHLGRPKEGQYQSKFSLKIIFKYLQKKIPYPIIFIKKYINNEKISLKSGELAILENVRFNIGENKNNKSLGKKYAKLCDIFVMDAFATSHRIHASTNKIIEFSKISCIGKLFLHEINMLNKILKNPKKPMISIIGGAKISTKLKLLYKITKISNFVIIGGGIANTLFAAKGYNIGKSFYEPKLIYEAKKLLNNKKIILAKDVQVTKKLSEKSTIINKKISCIKKNEYIVDLGEKFCKKMKKIIKKSKSLLWNGPLGIFEFTNARKSTKILAKCIKKNKIFSIAGGGETIAAIDMTNIKKYISYISTGGGAFLKFIEQKNLPTIKKIKKYSQKNT